MRLLPTTTLSLVLGLVAVGSMAGCAVNAAEEGPTTDEEAVAESEDALTGAPSNFGYFLVTRRDTRRCVSPMCGGFYVKRVNEAKTTCADGSAKAECYVSSIQLGGIGLSAREEQEFRAALESGTALVKAKTYKTKFAGQTLGVLKASEGWRGVTGAKVDGTFYRGADNGIRCIKAPCPSQTAYGLNGAESHNVIDVVFPASADPKAVERAENAAWTKDGVLVNGGVALPKCLPNANCGPLLMASEFYLRVVRTEGIGCGGRMNAAVTCNDGQFCQWSPGAICGRADAPGACAYKPDVCNRLFAPVCGCDGNNYGNACDAAAAGTSVLNAGVCAAAN